MVIRIKVLGRCCVIVDKVEVVIQYYQKNGYCMKYDEYCKVGYCIGSGVIEFVISMVVQ